MLGVLIVVALASAPAPVAATHGLMAVYASNDGTEQKVGVYVSGGGNTQTWAFAGTRGACTAVGSIEVGFGACAGVSGTGHFHPFSTVCPPTLDQHGIIINGKPGTVTVFC